MLSFPSAGFNDQVTFELLVPVTVAVNCCACDGPNDTVSGFTETLIVGFNLTVALADFVGSAALAAVTVTD